MFIKHAFYSSLKIKSMKKLFMLLCVAFLLFATATSFSQMKIDTTEITSNVPELTGFHEVIFPMWHTAYPAKDYNALEGYVSQIKAPVQAINNAKLPGILRDKEPDWKNQLNELNTAAKNYYTAVEKNDNEALLVAAERLHYNFEQMNRVIRPVIKEIDDYHQTLYIIYHKLYPDKKYAEIAGLANTLIEKADVIAKYPQDNLMKRLGDNVSRFDIAAKELYNATVALKEALNGDDSKKKDETIENVHTAYQNLNSV